MKKIIKKIGWILFLGLIACVIVGALVSFLNFAVSAPLLLLKTVVPVNNNIFLIFLTIIILFLVGLLSDYFLTISINRRKKLLENCKLALTKDNEWAIIMSEQPCSQEEKRYFNIWKSFTHPFIGDLKPIPEDKLRFLANLPQELITHYASYGLIPLKNLVFVEKPEFKSQITD